MTNEMLKFLTLLTVVVNLLAVWTILVIEGCDLEVNGDELEVIW